MNNLSLRMYRLLSGAQRIIQMEVRKELSPYKITPVQYSILECIADLDLHSPKEIAAYLGIENSFLSCNLEKLEKNSLIERKISMSDRRCIYIDLTETCEAMRLPFRQAVTQADGRLKEQFCESDLNHFCEMLDRINTLVI